MSFSIWITSKRKLKFLHMIWVLVNSDKKLICEPSGFIWLFEDVNYAGFSLEIFNWPAIFIFINIYTLITSQRFVIPLQIRWNTLVWNFSYNFLLSLIITIMHVVHIPQYRQNCVLWKSTNSYSRLIFYQQITGYNLIQLLK